MFRTVHKCEEKRNGYSGIEPITTTTQQTKNRYGTHWQVVINTSVTSCNFCHSWIIQNCNKKKTFIEAKILSLKIYFHTRTANGTAILKAEKPGFLQQWRIDNCDVPQYVPGTAASEFRFLFLQILYLYIFCGTKHKFE